MLRSLFAALLLLSAYPAAADPPPTKIPVDQAARNSFLNESGDLIDTMAALNKYVNGAITYETDQAHYGVRDHWVGRPTDLKGDCEDYALTKLELLGDMGWPIISRARIRTVTIRDGGQLYGHAILEILLPNGSIAELDSRFPEPMRREELERTYAYRFFDW